MDDRSLRIAVLLSAHVIFLSAAALRILRGQRAHQLVASAPWWVQYYPPLVWLPFVVAYVLPIPVDLAQTVQFAGLGLCLVSALFAVPAFSQAYLAGNSTPLRHEDQAERGQGPELGDYLGLPINDAASSWSGEPSSTAQTPSVIGSSTPSRCERSRSTGGASYSIPTQATFSP